MDVGLVTTIHEEGALRFSHYSSVKIVVVLADFLLSTPRKMERLTPPADRHNTTGEINLRIHGTNGMTHLLHGVPGYTP